ncbi:Maf family protein [uncultured Jatrophihabitans sp.]|uniref:Maf family protein n=1 Tax=uncultured Jatrophihabitans sp. TaxID=1610747 RepID=UPI0035CB760E
MRFVLASASPARLATLRAAGVDPEVVVSGVDESVVTAADTGSLVAALADLKARAVADTIDDAAIVLGCDSMLDLDGVALGKPGSPEAAAERWQAMRGRTGTLWTGHCLLDLERDASVVTAEATNVAFADVTDDEIARYTATGEPSPVAGAFTLDGLGGWFVERVTGDPHNVVGVSLPRLRRMLGELGRDLTDVGWPGRERR